MEVASQLEMGVVYFVQLIPDGGKGWGGGRGGSEVRHQPEVKRKGVLGGKPLVATVPASYD